MSLENTILKKGGEDGKRGIVRKGTLFGKRCQIPSQLSQFLIGRVFQN